LAIAYNRQQFTAKHFSLGTLRLKPIKIINHNQQFECNNYKSNSESEKSMENMFGLLPRLFGLSIGWLLGWSLGLLVGWLVS